MSRITARHTRAVLQVNPITCDGVGMCSHFAPDLIGVDEWGYPIVPTDELTTEELKQARAAIAACPVRALTLVAPR